MYYICIIYVLYMQYLVCVLMGSTQQKLILQQLKANKHILSFHPFLRSTRRVFCPMFMFCLLFYFEKFDDSITWWFDHFRIRYLLYCIMLLWYIFSYIYSGFDLFIVLGFGYSDWTIGKDIKFCLYPLISCSFPATNSLDFIGWILTICSDIIFNLKIIVY